MKLTRAPQEYDPRYYQEGHTRGGDPLSFVNNLIGAHPEPPEVTARQDEEYRRIDRAHIHLGDAAAAVGRALVRRAVRLAEPPSGSSRRWFGDAPKANPVARAIERYARGDQSVRALLIQDEDSGAAVLLERDAEDNPVATFAARTSPTVERPLAVRWQHGFMSQRFLYSLGAVYGARHTIFFPAASGEVRQVEWNTDSRSDRGFVVPVRTHSRDDTLAPRDLVIRLGDGLQALSGRIDRADDPTDLGALAVNGLPAGPEMQVPRMTRSIGLPALLDSLQARD